MRAVIPVAGVGERLRPFTHTTPKPLLSMAGKPILAHIIDKLLEEGIDELMLVVGYMGEKIEEFIRARYDVPVRVVWQDELLGLGYAVHIALRHIDNDEPFLLVLGDTIIETDISKILSSNGNTIGIVWVNDPRRFGVVELSGKRIVNMEEKPSSPRSNWAIAGLYYFSSTSALKRELERIVHSDIRTKGEIQLTDAMSAMLKSGEKFYAQVIEGWYDCGKPETLLSTHRHLLEKSETIVPDSVNDNIIIQPVYIAKTVSLKNSIIGPYVSIGEDAIVRNSIVRDSIVGDRTSLNNCVLESSILGNDSIFSAMPFRINLGDSSTVELEWE